MLECVSIVSVDYRINNLWVQPGDHVNIGILNCGSYPAPTYDSETILFKLLRVIYAMLISVGEGVEDRRDDDGEVIT